MLLLFAIRITVPATDPRAQNVLIDVKSLDVPLSMLTVPCSNRSSSLSLHTPNTPDSGKSMHAIAKTVKETESRVDAFMNAPSTDDPFTLGHHGGQHSGKRVWNLFEKLTDIDKRFNAGSDAKRS